MKQSPIRTLPEKDPARTILQPENNLLCGVKIMENQMLTQRKPLLSSTSYWVTLRPATISYKIFCQADEKSAGYVLQRYAAGGKSKNPTARGDTQSASSYQVPIEPPAAPRTSWRR